MESLREHLHKIPSVNWLIEKLSAEYPDINRIYLQHFIDLYIKKLHREPQKFGLFKIDKEPFRKKFSASIIKEFYQIKQGSLQRVINATGIVLHTGLGRAPLNPEIIEKIHQVGRYANLEISLESGRRGQRNDHLSTLLQILSGAENGFAVNNNAAAVMLMLNSVAYRKEVILSRGEMIEIGGSFRLPEVMKMSGCKLKEIGTTNKTHFQDYRQAISEKTGAILICHTSNYQINGFTSKPDLADLVTLAGERHIPLIYDLGSGSFEELERGKAYHEPLVTEIVNSDVDLVSFSGDKLLAGPQAGLIIGKEKWVKKCAKNHLLRALRLDKLIIAALQETLIQHLYKQNNLDGLSALNLDVDALRKRSEMFMTHFSEKFQEQLKVVEAYGKVGSGAYPTLKLPSVAIQIKPSKKSTSRLAIELRKNDPPIFGYIDNDVFHLDLRAVNDREEQLIVKALKKIL